MAKFQKTEKYEGVKSEKVFEAGKEVFDEMGMEILKVRSFAFFLQAHKKDGEVIINANFIVSAFQNEFSLTLTSDTSNQQRLDSIADDYLGRLKRHLSEK